MHGEMLVKIEDLDEEYITILKKIMTAKTKKSLNNTSILNHCLFLSLFFLVLLMSPLFFFLSILYS